jgi:23S rRNA maturation mini-RNase III
MGGGMMQQQEMLMTEMWDALTDDQKKEMLKRALDGKIMMKKGMIEHFKFKIETFEMLKKMLDES